MQDRTQQLHEAIRKAVRERRTNDHRLARLLAEFDHERRWAEMRYPSLQAYAKAEHDLNTRDVREKRRLGQRLLELPELDAVLAAGDLDWTKARTVLSVITPENEAAWIERVLHSTVRELEAQVRVAVRGEAPPDPREARLPERSRLVMDVETQDKQTIRDTIALVRAQSGDVDITDGEILAMICAAHAETLEGSDRPTGPVHQVIVEWCPGCNDAHGVECELSDTLISEAGCNPEVVDMRPGPDQGKLSRKVPRKVQRQVFHRARHRCEVPGCCNRLWLHIHHLKLWSEGGDHALENLMCLCSAHHREAHDGHLAIELLPDGSMRFERADGRVLIRPPHVGRASRIPSRHMGGPLILLLAAAHAADLAPVAQAEVVFLGTLKAQERGSTGLSMPPVYTGTLTFTDVEALRGTAPEALKYSLRQPDAPEWPAGKRFLAAASDGMLKLVVEATDAVVAEARETAKLPIGWSPGHSPWPDERPPWLAGSGLVLTVEQVPPEVPQKYKNDYGDGKFALTLTNPGAEPVTVEALRRDANGILWEQSVLASAHRFSDAPLPEGTEAVVLGPGEEVEAVLDTLKLDGVDWPRGGARVPFTFSLGELAASSFFYYTSSLHDPMRENR